MVVDLSTTFSFLSLYQSVTQFFAVLRTQLLGTLRAFECLVGMFPEALGIHHHTQLPQYPHSEAEQHQRSWEEAVYEHHGREHHQMIPVEYPAGGAAAGLHQQSERTPYQHAD